MAQIEVILTEEYTGKLQQQIENIIDRVVENKKAQLQPYKRYLTRTELCKFLGIGNCTLENLARAGLRYAVVGNKHLFDIEEVYTILETFKK